jgi:hypothetical protein
VGCVSDLRLAQERGPLNSSSRALGELRRPSHGDRL